MTEPTTANVTDDVALDFAWHPQPAAAQLIDRLLSELADRNAAIARFGRRLRDETGTRLVDWIDHIRLPAEDSASAQLAGAGFGEQATARRSLWRHPGALLPTIVVEPDVPRRLSLKVESVDDFLAAAGLDDATEIDGVAGGPWRSAVIGRELHAEWAVIERHGCDAYDPPDVGVEQIAAAVHHAGMLRRRRRAFHDPADGFAHAEGLVKAAAADLGVPWACDLFFAAERNYWQRRNRAAGVQRQRQDRLGLGWANHDHHTYRSSRACFGLLVQLLETLGFTCRERFYAGREAGWGAQVLEHERTGVVIFADVDLSAEEVTGDFAHEGLAPRQELGTVGLWCRLHGEAMLEAGMHHLECQFDFAAARQQLAGEGIASMAPFTDFPHLKQCFTEAEVWQVFPDRIDAALAAGQINETQAERFLQHGSLGSHLEILERNDGYRGFNQSGINDIIRDTDPRRAS